MGNPAVQMRFRVLGPLEVTRAGERVHIGSRMQRRLLVLLLINAGTVVRPDRVIDVLWDDDPPPSARKGAQTYVSRLRGLLGDGAEVESDAHGYRLRVDADDLDALRFEQLVSTARERLADDPTAAATGLQEALSLWRGPALAEFADEEFARPEALRLEGLRLVASEDAFAARLAGGDAGVIPDLEAFVAANPLRERPHAQLMTALARAGRQSEALEVLQRLRSKLADELGLEPSPALRQVQGDILRQAPSVTPPATGLSGPGGTEPASADQSTPVDLPKPGNLPKPVTSFVGRDAECDAVCQLLREGRLVTLTGVGGVGKTRLALQVATSVTELFPDGVWWVELAPADVDAVGHAVATVLGVQQQPNRGIAESIVGALAGKQLLLVLDNCEHVVSAASLLAEHLLRTCPEITILATGREPLAADGEQVRPVPPLPLSIGDSADDDVRAPSAQLFLDRARARHADFTVDTTTAAAVADICRQLDGLPLAIELAAALVPALDTAEIAQRLGHRFGLLTLGSRAQPRHRSLAAVVEWSYRLLEPDEQRLFDQLAVFAGGFTLDAAESVCADDVLPADRIAGLLAGLVKRSMVGVDRSTVPARYRLLETLRQYAERQLAERDGRTALRARHAAWCADLAERADIEVRGPGEAEAVALLEAEFANLRAAHRWAVEHDDADLALRLVAALHAFAAWRLRDEVFAWAEAAAELPAAAGHPLQPVVWGVAARGLSNRGELTAARKVAERALAAVPETADPRRLAALDALEAAALYEGRLTDCRHHAQQALTVARRHGDTYNSIQAQLHDALALIYGHESAAPETALALRTAADRLGNPHHRAWSRYALAEARGSRDPDQALELLQEALVMAAPVRDRFLQGVALVAIASLRVRHHSPRRALSSFADVIAHWRHAGDWVHQWPTIRNLVPLLVSLGEDEPAGLLYGAQRAADTAAPAYGDDAVRLTEAYRVLSGRVGASTAERLVTQGEQLTGAEAVDLALASIADLLRASS